MADDAAAAEIEQIGRVPGPCIGLGRLSAPLARPHDRQRTIVLGKERRAHRLEGLHEALVRLPVFDADAVDLELIHPEEPPELLPDRKLHSQTAMAREDVPAVAMGVEHEAGALAQEGDAAHSDGIDVDDRRIAAGRDHQIVVSHHLVGIGMGYAEGIHDLLAGLLLVVEDSRHDGCYPRTQRRIGRAHQLLVVLDEIHPGGKQLADEYGGFLWPQTQRRLDDRADDRAAFDTGQAPAADDTELRTRMRSRELRRQLHIHDADAGHSLDGIDAADRNGHQGGKIRSHRIEREGNLRIGAVEARGASRLVRP